MTLHQLRKDSKLKWHEVVAKAREYDPSFPTTAAGLSCLERRGTENYYQIVALSHAYSKPFAEMLFIASPARQGRTPENISLNAKYPLHSV